MQVLETGIINQTLKDLFVPNPDILKGPPPSSNPEAGDKSRLSLLFLDIDGVLNGAHIQTAFGTLPFPNTDKDRGFVDDRHAIDVIAARLINVLCHSTGSLIVLSSSWRIGFDLKSILIMLENLGIDPSLVIGRTDTLYEQGSEFTRGNQIQRFLNDIQTIEGRARMVKYDMLLSSIAFPEDTRVSTYAIVDDDDDMLESQKGNFVQTTFMDGLRLSQVLELGKILSNDETFYLNNLKGLPSAGSVGEAKLTGLN